MFTLAPTLPQTFALSCALVCRVSVSESTEPASRRLDRELRQSAPNQKLDCGWTVITAPAERKR